MILIEYIFFYPVGRTGPNISSQYCIYKMYKIYNIIYIKYYIWLDEILYVLSWKWSQVSHTCLQASLWFDKPGTSFFDGYAGSTGNSEPLASSF